MTDTYLERIAALLRKAESTDSEHEAEALVSKAQQLATMHAIDLAVARAFIPARERVEQPMIKRVPIGVAGSHGLKTFVQLFVNIARANDLTCDIAHNSTSVFCFGMPSDIEACETLYASLAVQMVDASSAWIKKGEYKQETVWSTTAGTYRPVRANTARISFQNTFAATVGARLRQARRDAISIRDEAPAAPEAPNLTVTLVLADKRDEVKAFHASHSNARGSWKGVDSFSASASRAGRDAGLNARLSPSKAITGSRGYLQ